MIRKLTYEFQIKVEPAGMRHLEVMSEIARVAAPKWFKRSYLKREIKHRRAFVSLVGRIPGGFLIWNRDFWGFYFIDLLVVHPELRRRGVARELLRAMEKLAEGKKLFTSTNMSNKTMQKLLKKSGYVKAGYIKFIDRGDPEWIYYKKL